MQDRPDRVELLGAVARFLGEQVVPTLPDRGLAFRGRIAAWLLELVARELTVGEAHDFAELGALQLLLAEPLSEQPTLFAERAEIIGALRARLATEIREAPLDEARFAELAACLKETIADKLSVVQPRFDLAADPEAP